jgi:hypothetical protein
MRSAPLVVARRALSRPPGSGHSFPGKFPPDPNVTLLINPTLKLSVAVDTNSSKSSWTDSSAASFSVSMRCASSAALKASSLASIAARRRVGVRVSVRVRVRVEAQIESLQLAAVRWAGRGG